MLEIVLLMFTVVVVASVAAEWRRSVPEPTEVSPAARRRSITWFAALSVGFVGLVVRDLLVPGFASDWLLPSRQALTTVAPVEMGDLVVAGLISLVGLGIFLFAVEHDRSSHWIQRMGALVSLLAILLINLEDAWTVVDLALAAGLVLGLLVNLVQFWKTSHPGSTSAAVGFDP